MRLIQALVKSECCFSQCVVISVQIALTVLTGYFSCRKKLFFQTLQKGFSVIIFSVCCSMCRQKLPVNMHGPFPRLARYVLNWPWSQQDKRELRLLRSNRPILLMSMQLKFFALIKEVFSSVDYTNKINFKRWTVFYYSDSEFYI